MGDQAVSQVLWKPGDSHFWAGLMATKKFFFPHGSFSIRDGSEIRFWEDIWLGHSTLKEQYPALLSHQMFRSEEVYLEHGKHLGMLCSSDWTQSICRKVQISFNGISRRTANSRLILCIESSFYPKFQSIALTITNFGR